jgi:hypothetical protein
VFVYKPKIAAQFSAIFPIGEYKGIRADAGYSLWKRDEFVSTHNEGYEKYSSVTKQYISLKADFVYGLISPINKFWIYGSAGLGIHFLLDSPGDRFSSHYSYYDSAYHNYTYYDEGRTNVSSVFSIGFAVGYRFNKQLGFYADTQLNTVSHSTFFLAFFDSGESYIPVRAGVTYILY